MLGSASTMVAASTMVVGNLAGYLVACLAAYLAAYYHLVCFV